MFTRALSLTRVTCAFMDGTIYHPYISPLSPLYHQGYVRSWMARYITPISPGLRAFMDGTSDDVDSIAAFRAAYAEEP